MLGLVIAILVTVIVAYMVLTKKKAQTVLFLGGFILLACAILMGKPILNAKQTTGFTWFDIFKFVENTFSTRAAGIGLLIMAVGGFAKYMDHIGASRVLVRLTAKPLGIVKSPYVLLAASYVVGQLLNIVIPSAAGLCVLLMATMYPVLTSLGVSRLSSAAVIATTPCLDLGPASGTAVFAAKTAGLEVTDYFIGQQLPIAVVSVVAIAAAHFFVQRYFDRKDGGAKGVIGQETVSAVKAEEAVPPAVYAVLPIIPIGLVLVFSKLCIPYIKMPVVTAMLLSIAVAMAFELVRTRDVKTVFNSIQVFFDGMGKIFATVITLIVAGETFAYGLMKIGAIDMIIHGAESTGFGSVGIMLVMTLVVAAAAVVMGSGNAPFYSFGALVPDIAAKMGISSVAMITSMQLASSIARSASPITAAVVAVAGIANVSPVDVVKRTAIPMVVALVVSVAANLLLG